MNIYNGLIKKELLKEFSSYYAGLDSYFNYVGNHVTLEGVLACAGLFSPDFIEIDNRIYLLENLAFKNENEIQQYFSLAKNIVGNNPIEIQKYINRLELGNFFLMAKSPALDNDKLFDKFAETIQCFWQQRLTLLFPNRNFDFLIQEDLFGEEGLNLTFYENFI